MFVTHRNPPQHLAQGVESEANLKNVPHVSQGAFHKHSVLICCQV